MKPSLPLKWFDLVFIPEHDGLYAANNVVSTQGVINKIKPARNYDLKKGLFLIGGPSKHYRWNSPNVVMQIEAIVNAQPEMHWQLTTSRRTPDDFIGQLNRVKNIIDIIPHTETDSGWLPRQLNETGQVWVSRDSVSMIYEALTSGASTALLEIPVAKSSRVQQGIDRLLSNKTLTSFSAWIQTRKIDTAETSLNEAARCADIILNRYHYAG